jgi:hypothetical protein
MRRGTLVGVRRDEMEYALVEIVNIHLPGLKITLRAR